MILLFDGVSSSGYIALYSESRDLIAQQSFHIAGNESSQTVPLIDAFVRSQAVSYEQIENIVCVIGPGSFTGIRTLSLVVNTLAFIYPHIKLTGVSFFDLYHHFPIIKSSSKRDLFVKYEKSATISIVSNADFEQSCNDGAVLYGDCDMTRFEKNLTLSSEIDYDTFLKNLILEDNRRLAPLYIKKPNIS